MDPGLPAFPTQMPDSEFHTGHDPGVEDGPDTAQGADLYTS